MDKKRKVIMIIIVVLLVLLIGIGTFTYINYSKESNSSKTNSYGEDVSSDDISAEFMYFDTYDDVIIYLNSQGINVSFSKEEDSCWYFVSDENSIYKYCSYDGNIVQES